MIAPTPTALTGQVDGLLDQQRAKKIRDVRFLLDNRRPISGGALALRQSRKLRRQILHRHVMRYIRPILRSNDLPTRRHTPQLPAHIL